MLNYFWYLKGGRNKMFITDRALVSLLKGNFDVYLNGDQKYWKTDLLSLDPSSAVTTSLAIVAKF